MSTLSFLLYAIAGFFLLLQVSHFVQAYAMLRSGQHRRVEVGLGAGLVSMICTVLAAVLR